MYEHIFSNKVFIIITLMYQGLLHRYLHVQYSKKQTSSHHIIN